MVIALLRFGLAALAGGGARRREVSLCFAGPFAGITQTQVRWVLSQPPDGSTPRRGVNIGRRRKAGKKGLHSGMGGALVPAAQENKGERRKERVDRNPGQRDQRERGEHARYIEPVAGLGDAERKTRALAGIARGELGDDSADERKAATDSEAAEEIGKRGGQAQIKKHLPAACAVEPEKIDEVAVRGGKPKRGVRQNGEKRDEKGAGKHRCWRLEINQEQGRNRHDGSDLQNDCKGQERALGPFPLREENRKASAAANGRSERTEGCFERHSQGRKEDRPVGNQRCANERWRGQHIRRNGLQTDIGFPPSQQRCKRNRGRRVAYGPLRQSHCTLPICAGAVEQRANL